MLREGVIFNRLMYVLVVCCCLLLFVAFLYVCMYPPLHIDNVVRTLPVRRLLVSRLAATTRERVRRLLALGGCRSSYACTARALDELMSDNDSID